MSLFTKKDLGLLLPDDIPGDPVSLRYTKTKEETEVFKPLKPQVDPSVKVARYRAGQVPKFAHGYEEERGFVTANSQVRVFPKATAQHKMIPVIKSGRKRVQAQVVRCSLADTKTKRDREQKEMVPSNNEEGSSEDDVAKALQDSSSDEEDESDIDRRRRLLRSKAASRVDDESGEKDGLAELDEKGKRQPVEAQVVKRSAVAASVVMTNNGSSESSGSSSPEYETDTDDSETGEELMKPIFVPKKARNSLKSREELAAEEERREKRELEKLEARKMESRRTVAEEIRREQEGASKGDDTDVEMPDDTDGLDPTQEYRDWELREMRRIKRDRDRKQQRREDAKETLRRRNMSEEERVAEDAKLKKNEPKEKKKLKFMQKYYHKGAFYVDDDSIRVKDDVRKRDATDATLEDKFNKEMLPAVMQVKNFGRAGRTKYTHLVDQDTSSRDSLWARDDSIREKYKSRLGGMKDIDGSTKRRRKE